MYCWLTLVSLCFVRRQEEELYRHVIGSYEARQKELLVENTEMRQCLSKMQAEVVALLRAPDSSDKESLNSSTGVSRKPAANRKQINRT